MVHRLRPSRRQTTEHYRPGGLASISKLKKTVAQGGVYDKAGLCRTWLFRANAEMLLAKL
jgi:hypothetical protein